MNAEIVTTRALKAYLNLDSATRRRVRAQFSERSRIICNNSEFWGIKHGHFFWDFRHLQGCCFQKLLSCMCLGCLDIEGIDPGYNWCLAFNNKFLVLWGFWRWCDSLSHTSKLFPISRSHQAILFHMLILDYFNHQVHGTSSREWEVLLNIVHLPLSHP